MAANNTARSNAMKAIPRVLLAYIEGLKGHDVKKIAGTVADDLRFITPATTVGKERFLNFLRALYAAFPDWQYEHDEPEVRADEIAVKWRQGGTHTGTLALPGIEVAATGKKVRIPDQFFFYQLREGQIVQIRPEPIAGGAPLGILEQIGVEWPSS